MSHHVDLTLSDDLESFRRLGHLAVDMTTDYLSQIRQKPVFNPMAPDERQELLGATLRAYPKTCGTMKAKTSGGAKYATNAALESQ
jgi:hypothetical protein